MTTVPTDKIALGGEPCCQVFESQQTLAFSYGRCAYFCADLKLTSRCFMTITDQELRMQLLPVIPEPAICSEEHSCRCVHERWL